MDNFTGSCDALLSSTRCIKLYRSSCGSIIPEPGVTQSASQKWDSGEAMFHIVECDNCGSRKKECND